MILLLFESVDRKQQNRALAELDEFMSHIEDPATLRARIEMVIMRGRHSSGIRWRKRGQLGEMNGTPPPYYGDPTGEEAIWDELFDHTSKQIHSVVIMLRKINTIAAELKDLSNMDVEKRALRSIPDCLACGDPCVARVISGFDDKCYKAWQRAGRPDRAKFIRDMQTRRNVNQDDMDEID